MSILIVGLMGCGAVTPLDNRILSSELPKPPKPPKPETSSQLEPDVLIQQSAPKIKNSNNEYYALGAALEVSKEALPFLLMKLGAYKYLSKPVLYVTKKAAGANVALPLLGVSMLADIDDLQAYCRGAEPSAPILRWVDPEAWVSYALGIVYSATPQKHISSLDPCKLLEISKQEACLAGALRVRGYLDYLRPIKTLFNFISKGRIFADYLKRDLQAVVAQDGSELSKMTKAQVKAQILMYHPDKHSNQEEKIEVNGKAIRVRDYLLKLLARFQELNTSENEELNAQTGVVRSAVEQEELFARADILTAGEDLGRRAWVSSELLVRNLMQSAWALTVGEDSRRAVIKQGELSRRSEILIALERLIESAKRDRLVAEELVAKGAILTEAFLNLPTHNPKINFETRKRLLQKGDAILKILRSVSDSKIGGQSLAEDFELIDQKIVMDRPVFIEGFVSELTPQETLTKAISSPASLTRSLLKKFSSSENLQEFTHRRQVKLEKVVSVIWALYAEAYKSNQKITRGTFVLHGDMQKWVYKFFLSYAYFANNLDPKNDLPGSWLSNLAYTRMGKGILGNRLSSHFKDAVKNQVGIDMRFERNSWALKVLPFEMTHLLFGVFENKDDSVSVFVKPEEEGLGDFTSTLLHGTHFMMPSSPNSEKKIPKEIAEKINSYWGDNFKDSPVPKTIAEVVSKLREVGDSSFIEILKEFYGQTGLEHRHGNEVIIDLGKIPAGEVKTIRF